MPAKETSFFRCFAVRLVDSFHYRKPAKETVGSMTISIYPMAATTPFGFPPRITRPGSVTDVHGDDKVLFYASVYVEWRLALALLLARR